MSKKEFTLTPRLRLIFALAGLAVALAVLAIVIMRPFGGDAGSPGGGGAAPQRQSDTALLDAKASALWEEIGQSELGGDALAPLTQFSSDVAEYVVFLSVCDKSTRASVVCGTGASLRDAYQSAWDKARYLPVSAGQKPVWVKADVVTSVEAVQRTALESDIHGYWDEFYRKGIALTADFSLAFLEAEVNGNKLIDYDTDTLDLPTIQEYCTTFDRAAPDSLPEDLWTFVCQGWFCDEDESIYRLTAFEGGGLDYGRRDEPLTRESVAFMVDSASQFLAGVVDEDGKFLYGLYPTYDRLFTSYNMLRHAVSIQPMIWDYNLTGDESLLPPMERALDYLCEDSVEYQSDGVAYVMDRQNEEVKLGGNALAIILLHEYRKQFETDEYVDLCRDLGEGILALMGEDGSFYHVLNLDFSPKEEFRTVYYDGEATYALAVLYEMTGEEKYLDAACLAVDRFIEEDYTQYRDHWVAYALNEVTKHVPSDEYLSFGLLNAQVNLEEIYHRETSYHTYMELLMATFEMYDRIISEGLTPNALTTFSDTFFFETIFRRAEHMRNGFLYPEYAMYLKNPARIVNTFCVRHDGYRVRIDDVDHFVAGYYHFLEYYDKLVEYRQG